MTEVYCSVCGDSEDLDVAVDGGEWIPFCWDETLCPPAEHGPVCPVCVMALGICLGDDGEWVRRGVSP